MPLSCRSFHAHTVLIARCFGRKTFVAMSMPAFNHPLVRVFLVILLLISGSQMAAAGVMAKACGNAFVVSVPKDAPSNHMVKAQSPVRPMMPCSQSGLACNASVNCATMAAVLSTAFVFDRMESNLKQAPFRARFVRSISSKPVLPPPII